MQKGGASTPTYKLTYFNVTAKAETIRMLFRVGKTKFEDKRLTFEEFGAMKKDTPFGQLPVLEIKDAKGKHEFCQTKAIAKYLARKFGLLGTGELEELKVDMVLDCLADIRPSLESILFPGDKSAEQLKKTFLEEKADTMFANLEKMVDQGHFNKNKLSVADIELWNLVQFSQDAAKVNLESILSGKPKLKEVLKNVKENGAIKEWIEVRPKGMF